MLLGENWLEKLKINWSTTFKVSQVPAVEDILAKYEALRGGIETSSCIKPWIHSGP